MHGHKYKRLDEVANGTGSCQDIPLIVLVDEGSASASEIFSGAIQDNDRGTIVGRRSFGKGLVQQPINFSDGSAIRLTIARYYTPSGRCIQRPYENGKDRNYEMDLYNRYTHGEFFSKDSIKLDESQRYSTGLGRPGIRWRRHYAQRICSARYYRSNLLPVDSIKQRPDHSIHFPIHG